MQQTLPLRVVMLDALKLDAYLNHNPYDYPGAGGGNPQRLQRVSHLLGQTNPRVEMPIMYAAMWSNTQDFASSVQVADGRHRLYLLLHQANVLRIPVVVPLFQASLFRQTF